MFQPLGLYSIHIVVRNGQTTLYGVVDTEADRRSPR
jgi:osmotically-inducible protein OsmY